MQSKKSSNLERSASRERILPSRVVLRSRNRELNECSATRGILLLLLGQVLADGEVSSAELRCLQRLAREVFALERSDVRRIVREALELYARCGEVSIEIAAMQLRRFLSEQERHLLLKALIAMAGADQQFHDHEQYYVLTVARRLGLDVEEASKLWSSWASHSVH